MGVRQLNSFPIVDFDKSHDLGSRFEPIPPLLQALLDIWVNLSLDLSFCLHSTSQRVRCARSTGSRSQPLVYGRLSLKLTLGLKEFKSYKGSMRRRHQTLDGVTSSFKFHGTPRLHARCLPLRRHGTSLPYSSSLMSSRVWLAWFAYTLYAEQRMPTSRKIYR